MARVELVIPARWYICIPLSLDMSKQTTLTAMGLTIGGSIFVRLMMVKIKLITVAAQLTHLVTSALRGIRVVESG